MLIRTLPGFAALVLTAACAGAPQFTQTEYVETRDIFLAVENDLCKAIDFIESNPLAKAEILAAGLDYRRFVASVTVGLQVTEVTDAQGNVSIIVPVNTGTATLGVLAGRTRTHTRSTALKVYYPFGELDCQPFKAASSLRIAGHLGLTEWIGETTKVLIAIRETPVAYSYDVNFTIEGAVGAAPSFSILPSARPLFGGAELTAGRALTHSLSVTVVEITPDAELAARSRIPPETRRRLERESDIQIIRNSGR